MKLVLGIVALGIALTSVATAEPIVINVWPDSPPGDLQALPPESDLTRETDPPVAGRRIIKLGNVSTPQLAIYRPAAEPDTGAAVVICPGGGHHILAYDLEGTEVAEWLNRLGITGIVLKYRVPFRDPQQRWKAAVQDAQRAMSVVRSRAAEWNLKPDRIGILGFSAGGQVATLVSLHSERHYAPVDAHDEVSFRPDFAVVIYPGGLTEKDRPVLREEVRIPPGGPPFFLVHAFDDPVTPLNSLLLATELKKAGITTEIHMFAKGGHGYGLRHVDGVPVTDWPVACTTWLKSLGVISE